MLHCYSRNGHGNKTELFHNCFFGEIGSLSANLSVTMKTITVKSFTVGLMLLWNFGYSGQARADCIGDCQQRYRDKVNLINKLFNSSGDSAHYHNLQWQRESLDAAKNEFDACRATCR